MGNTGAAEVIAVYAQLADKLNGIIKNSLAAMRMEVENAKAKEATILNAEAKKNAANDAVEKRI